MDSADSLVDSEVATDSSNIDSLRNLFSSPGIETVDPTSSTPVRPIKRSKAERKNQSAANESDIEAMSAKVLRDALEGAEAADKKITEDLLKDLNDAAAGTCSTEKSETATSDKTGKETADKADADAAAADAITVESKILSASDLASALEPGFLNATTEIKLTPDAVSRAQAKEAPEVNQPEQPKAAPTAGSELAAQAQGSTEETKVSRNDLVNALESFVSLIKNTGEVPPPNSGPNLLGMQSPPSQQKFTVQVDDKTAEVEELRCLLVEAQQTIIRLLTERVEDRAKVSQLETQLRLLPDLQAQADRAIAVAMNTDDFRRDLTKVKFELERVRLAKVRSEVERSRRSWFRGLRGWFFKTKDVIPADELDQGIDVESTESK